MNKKLCHFIYIISEICFSWPILLFQSETISVYRPHIHGRNIPVGRRPNCVAVLPDKTSCAGCRHNMPPPRWLWPFDLDKAVCCVHQEFYATLRKLKWSERLLAMHHWNKFHATFLHKKLLRVRWTQTYSLFWHMHTQYPASRSKRRSTNASHVDTNRANYYCDGPTIILTNNNISHSIPSTRNALKSCKLQEYVK